MENSLQEALEKLSVHSKTTTAPSVPAEIIQHILGFLDPYSEDTLYTVLACQLVSRSFAAASLAPVVWRPLVQAWWPRGELKYPTAKLPLDEDQELLDQLFPSPTRDAPSDPFLTFRTRARLGKLAKQHLKKLSEATSNRLLSLDTFRALGEQIDDIVHRVAEPTQEPALSLHFWAAETQRIQSRRRAVEQLLRAASDETVESDEAFELGVRALSDFADSVVDDSDLEFDELLKLLQALIPTEVRDGDRGAGQLGLLFHAWTMLESFVKAVGARAYEVSGGPKLDDLFYTPAFRRARAQKKLVDPAYTLEHMPRANHQGLCYLALIIAIGRRLPSPYTLRFESTDMPLLFRVCFAEDEDTGALVDLERITGSPLRPEPMRGSVWREHRGDSEQFRLLPGLLALQVLEVEEDQRLLSNQTTPWTLAVAAASLLLHISPVPYIFGPPRPAFIDFFRRPYFAYDVGILESLLASDSLSPAQREETAKIARSLRDQDAQEVVPKPRGARFPLKLHVGEPFWKGEELGVVVGWESKPRKRTTATPRRGRGGSAKPLALAPRSNSYAYLAIMESFDIAQDPTSVEEREIDLERQPNEVELSRLTKRCAQLGRFFRKLDTASGRFELTPEMAARYPEG